MNYEEKRELRLQISQLLADAGLNQGEIKRMVHETIDSKVNRAVDQCIEHLNAGSETGNYMEDYISRRMSTDFWTERFIKDAVFKAIQDKVLRIVIENDDVKVEER